MKVRIIYYEHIKQKLKKKKSELIKSKLMFFDCIILICPIDPMNNHFGISNLKKVIIYLLMYFHIS